MISTFFFSMAAGAGDEIAAAKLEQYERVLKQQNALNVLEKTQKFSRPFVSGSGKGKAYMEQLVWGELGDFVRGLVGGGRDREEE